jgi:hypothetical protein
MTTAAALCYADGLLPVNRKYGGNLKQVLSRRLCTAFGRREN